MLLICFPNKSPAPLMSKSRIAILNPLPLSESIFSIGTLVSLKNTCLVDDEWIPNFFSSSPNEDESNRFGLNSFKVLGSTFAIDKILDKQPKIDTFCTATDGNHGKGLAWAAQNINKKVIVYVPKDTTLERIKEIEKYNANVYQLNLNYEDTCVYAYQESKKNNWCLVQDASWDNYEEIPALIMSGYLTHFKEIECFKSNLFLKNEVLSSVTL